MNDSSRRKKLVFFINHLSFFCSHRMPIAIKAIQNNYDVHLIVGKEPNNDEKNVNEQKLNHMVSFCIDQHLHLLLKIYFLD